MTEHRSYYAIIPANVRYDKRLKPNTKLLYGEITALCNERGFCWAGNEYFADLYGVNKETISRWVSDLIKFGYLNREIIYKEGTNQIINRYLRINQYPIDEKRNTPIDEKVKDNNTSIGDVVVTLIILAMQNDMDLYECLNQAYNEIKGRTGKMVDGVFVKSSDLEDSE